MSVVVSRETDRSDFRERRGVETSAGRGEAEARDGERATAAAGEIGLERENRCSAWGAGEIRDPVPINVARGLSTTGEREAQRQQSGQRELFVHKVS